VWLTLPVCDQWVLQVCPVKCWHLLLAVAWTSCQVPSRLALTTVAIHPSSSSLPPSLPGSDPGAAAEAGMNAGSLGNWRPGGCHRRVDTWGAGQKESQAPPSRQTAYGWASGCRAASAPGPHYLPGLHMMCMMCMAAPRCDTCSGSNGRPTPFSGSMSTLQTACRWASGAALAAAVLKPSKPCRLHDIHLVHVLDIVFS
jgi:hypothetical protein